MGSALVRYAYDMNFLHHPLYIGGVPMKFDASVNESYFGEKSF
jgi:hypothetical protein